MGVISRLAESRMGKVSAIIMGMGSTAPIAYDMLNPPGIYAGNLDEQKTNASVKRRQLIDLRIRQMEELFEAFKRSIDYTYRDIRDLDTCDDLMCGHLHVLGVLNAIQSHYPDSSYNKAKAEEYLEMLSYFPTNEVCREGVRRTKMILEGSK